MSDVYKIAVNLAMTSNAPAFLSSLASQIFHVHNSVKDLEGGLKNLSRIKLAIGGGLSIAGGVEFLKGLKTITDQAKELNHQLASTATLASKPLTSLGLQGQALSTARATTRVVNGVSLEESVKLFNETYSMFGEQAAKINAPLAKMAMILGGITGNYESSFENLQALVKSGDLTGKIMNEKTHQVDTDKLVAYLGIAGQVAAATGGKVDPRTFFQIAQQGGPGIKNMSDEGLIGILMAAQGMGGFRAGTATMSMFSQFAGGKMTKQVAQELHDLGLVGNFKTVSGGSAQFDKGALDTEFAKGLLKDPLTSMKILRDALTAHHITGEDQTKEIFKIFGRQTTQRLVNDFLTNMEQMVQERGRLRGAQTLDQQNQTREDLDYDRNMHDVEVAWHNFMVEIGAPLTVTAIGILKDVTSVLKGWTETVRSMDPKMLQNIAVGIGVLGSALVGGGAVAILAALGPVGWVAAGIIALGAAVQTFAPDQMNQLTSGIAHFVDDLGKKNFKGAFDEYLKSLSPDLLTKVLATATINAIKGINWGTLGSDVFGGLKQAILDAFKGNIHDASGQLLRMITFANPIASVGVAIVDSLKSEIASWPSKLAATIAGMGSAIVKQLEDKLHHFLGPQLPRSPSYNEGDNIGALPQAFHGTGVYGGSMIKAAYSNDNALSADGPLDFYKSLLMIGEGVPVIASKLSAEIASWPNRLSNVIAGMGADIVAMISASLSNLGGLGGGSGGLIRASYEGSGFGGGAGGYGGSHASYGGSGGGGANDNASGGHPHGTHNMRHIASLHPFVGGAVPTGSNEHNLTALMESEAKLAGIDPRILHGIRWGESFHQDKYDIGDRNDGPAYGPLQLNVGRGRLGDIFQRQTHLNLADPRTIPAQVHWVANYIKHRLAADPHYNPGKEWFGFHGLRNALPWWRDSGYAPAPTQTHAAISHLAVPKVDPDWAAHRGGHVPMPANMRPFPGPPPVHGGHHHHHLTVHLDGKQIEARVTSHQADRSRFPTAVGGVDPHGHYASPGTPLIDVA